LVSFSQFWDVAQLVIIHKKILVKFGYTQDMKAEKHVFIILPHCRQIVAIFFLKS
jgi:hypothetical protein